jgi:Flp pilus assembly pilin Flp
MVQPLEIARDLWRDDDGATVMEYVLILLLVAMAGFAAVTALGLGLSGPFQKAIDGFH